MDVLKTHGVLLLELAFDGFRLLDNGEFYVLLRFLFAIERSKL